jgi:signal transduction histidine kinase/DNA-binding NarL/FixJ family response regulator/streptogramin lyase
MAHTFHVRSITPEQGLSHGYVSSLFQDSRGYIWIGTIYGLNRFDGYQCKAFTPNQLDEWALHTPIITAITEDRDGMLWLGTDNGLALFNPYSEKFIPLTKLNPKAPTGFIRDLLVDGDNNIWCTNLEGGKTRVCAIRNNARLPLFSSREKAAPPMLEINEPKLPEGFGTVIRLFFQTGNFSCLLANDAGRFLELNLRKKTFSPTPKPADVLLTGVTQRTLLFQDHDYGNSMHPDERLALLQSPEGAQYACQFFEKRIFQIEPGKHPKTSNEIEQSTVIATLDQPQSFARIVDRSGKIWVGTIGYGLRIIEPDLNAFQFQFPDINFCNPSPMPDGKIWAGMYDAEKFVDPKTGQVSNPIWAGALDKTETVKATLFDESYKNIILITEYRQQLWLAVFDPGAKFLRRIHALESFTLDPIMLYKDSKGAIWVAGTGGEVLRFDQQTQTAKHWRLNYLFPQKVDQGEQMARCIAEDKKGRIWIGSDVGLIRISYSPRGADFKSYHNAGKNGRIFRSPWIFSICPHAENPDQLWLATMSGGLARFDSKNEKLEYLDTDNELNLVIGMTTDRENNLWLATNKGILQYHPATNVFVTYAHLKHIPKISLNSTAIIKDASGIIYMGGAGMLTIKPDALKPQPVGGDLVVTDIQVNRKPAKAGIPGAIVSLDERKNFSLQLSHDDRFIAIHFSVPAAAIPEAVLYRYRLHGLHNDWILMGQKRTVELAGLAPGNYTLEVEAATSGEPWSQAKKISLPIRIAPPWYAGIPAYCFYALVLAALISAGFRYQRKRLSLQFTADLNRKEVERLHAMDEFKNRFFAYIAHEFKTPLTIIMGAGEYLRRLHSQDTDRGYPEAVIREGNNMLNLIHELIDVTRLQDKSIQLRYESLDIVAFLEKIVEAWKPVTAAGQIDLSLTANMPNATLDLDQTRTQYILNNLLSNAMKYTPPDGKISIQLEPADQYTARISISDTGTGIAPEDLPHIFEKYFQGSQKSLETNHFGLGLSFVKDLTELLGGKISVESTLGKGAKFSLELPMRAPTGIPVASRPDTQAPAADEMLLAQSIKAGSGAPQLLIVDDHPAIQSYLKQVLQPHFNLTFAKNGQEGLETAIEQIPDIILTDVMMPIMDGIAMTQELKAHQLTNHIPVVMLSAKNEIQDRLEGQEHGADAYLGKPFNNRELILTLHNLNRLQQRWKKRYAAIATGESSLKEAAEMPETFTQTVVSSNDAFMQKILDAFENHYASENFDAVELAALLNISKAQLYRKISKISNEGVMELLRNFRLKKAMKLLEKHPEMSTKEVAFNVGFKEYSHFSASFKKRFGVAPSEWRKSRIAR